MLRQVLASSAGAPREEIGYVEAHGTGTPLGDPIEFEALRAVLAACGAEGFRPSALAVKTATTRGVQAGMAGLTGAVMALQEEEVPKNLHFQGEPPISLEGTPFVLPTENLPWKRGDVPRLAGVSCSS